MPESISRTLQLIIDPSQARTGAQAVKKEMLGVETSINRGQLAVNRLSGAFRAMAGIIPMIGAGAAVYKTVNIIREYDRQLAATSSVVKATAEEIRTLDRTARELGSKTAFTATQAQSALETLLRSGRSVSEAVTMAGDALNLAVAEQLTMDEASGFLTDTLKIMNLEVERSANVADLYSKTASSANTTVRELGAAMVSAGAVARQFGWDLETTFGILAAWAEQGTRGGEAGTAFRSVFPKLLKADTIATAKGVLDELGIKYEDIDPTRNDPEKIVRTLGEAGLTLAQANKLVEVEMGVKLMQLVANYDLVGQKIREVGDYHGETARKAEVMADTITGKWNKVKSVVEAVILSKADENDIATVMKDALDFSADLISVLGGVAGEMDKVNTSAATFGEFLREHGQTLLALGVGFKTGGVYGALAAVGGLTAYRAYDVSSEIREQRLIGQGLDSQLEYLNNPTGYEGGPRTTGWGEVDQSILDIVKSQEAKDQAIIERLNPQRPGVTFGAQYGAPSMSLGQAASQTSDTTTVSGQIAIQPTTPVVPPPSYETFGGYAGGLYEDTGGRTVYGEEDLAAYESIVGWEEEYGDLLERNDSLLGQQSETLEGMKEQYERIQQAKRDMPSETERLILLEEELAQKIRLQESALANVAEGARIYREELSGVKTVAYEVAQAFVQVENQITEAFMSGEFHGRKFFNSILDSVRRLATEKLISEPIVGVISSTIGSIAGGLWGGGGAAPVSGGPLGPGGGGLAEIGGYTDGLLTHTVASAYSFAGAPSFASGGRPDGIPIVAHPNEVVIPLPDGRSVPTTQVGGGGGMVFAPRYTTLVVPGVSDATSFSQSRGRLLRSVRGI